MIGKLNERMMAERAAAARFERVWEIARDAADFDTTDRLDGDVVFEQAVVAADQVRFDAQDAGLLAYEAEDLAVWAAAAVVTGLRPDAVEAASWAIRTAADFSDDDVKRIVGQLEAATS